MHIDSFVNTRGCPVCGGKLWYLKDRNAVSLNCGYCGKVWEVDSVKDIMYSVDADRIYNVAETPIIQFRDKYSFLSNFEDCEISYKGFLYHSVEAAFQAQKCCSDEGRSSFTTISASQAKSMGRKVTLRLDWDKAKIGIMEDLLRIKFSDETLGFLLECTGQARLVEGNTWGDRFWGVDIKTLKGSNNLGKLLMEIRKDLCENKKGERK